MVLHKRLHNSYGIADMYCDNENLTSVTMAAIRMSIVCCNYLL